MTMQAIVLENEEHQKLQVTNALLELGFGVRAVEKGDDLLALAETGAYDLAILDIHMGLRRAQEGLDTLERLRARDVDTFVAMLSAYPDRWREMAEKLEADLFQTKTGHAREDVVKIVVAFLRSRIEALPTRAGDSPASSPAVSSWLLQDPNYVAANDALADPDMAAAFAGRWVGVVNCQLVHDEDDRVSLVQWLHDNHPHERAFVVQVLPANSFDEIIDFGGHFGVDE